ncbi:MAG: hypothetical protein HFF13_08970 [Angelakisella sp.]|jgi:hypothetical protein|nr:hypothetical protein [Angelakisella sp.]
MSNLTMTIQIEAPDLVAALTQLAAAIHPSAQTLNIPQPQVPAPAAPVPVAVAAPAPVPVTPQPPVTGPVVPPPPAVPAAPPAPAVPVAGAPAYTLDQLAKAGAALVDAGKMESLMALLAKYGVQAVTQLPPAQYGAFATELRALGAQI